MADEISKNLSDAIKKFEVTLQLFNASSNLAKIGTITSQADILRALDAIDAEQKLAIDLSSSGQDLQDAIDEQTAQLSDDSAVTPPTPEYEEGVPESLLGICEQDAFQGVRFYDGVSFGYLRIFPTKVELLVGEKYSFDIDGTIPHTYRIVAKGKDIRLYIDGTLAIDATGNFTLPSSERLIEFGDIAGRQQQVGSAWQSFKYSTTGDFSGDESDEFVLSEIMSLPGGGIGSIKSYNENLYVSYDPDDTGESSCLYRYQEGYPPEQRATLAITKSNITSVIVDPNRDGNVFGTSGKFIGTDRGLQYILGGKPQPFDSSTRMNEFPNENGWTLSESTTGTDQNIFNGVLTIDTRDEANPAFLKYIKDGNSDWGISAKNARGWTVEARVRISEDGNGSPLDLPTFYTPRDYVFVIDSSDAMSSGNNLAYAKELVKTFLASLHPGDNATVLNFDTSNHVWSSVLQQMTGDKVNELSQYVDQIIPSTSAGAKLLEALEYAVSLDFTHEDKSAGQTPASKGRIIVLIGSGNVTNVSYSDIPATITTANTTDAAIYAIGVGNNVFATASDKKKVYKDLATSNSGTATFLSDFDNIPLRAKDVWTSVAPEVFDWQTITDPSGKSLDARTSFLLNGNNQCVNTGSGNVQSSDKIPDEDGVNAPSILINDGTYQEVIQLFEKGVRLKYAKSFARVNLSEDFYTIRIIGKDTAIAVYAKSDSDGQWKRLIYAPNGLFVRATSIGDQEAVDIQLDSFGVPHAVWQDSREGNWQIMYSKGTPKKILATGNAHTSSSESIANIIQARVAFGLPPTTIQSLKSNGIIAPNAAFISLGVKAGDYISLRAFVDANGNKVVANGKYAIDQVLDEAIVILKTTENLPDIWTSAEYTIYRGEDSWSVPSLVSNQTMDSSNPSILVHSSGDIYVAYENTQFGSRDIFIRKGNSGPYTTSWKESVRVTHGSGTCFAPKLAELSNGNILAVWEDNRLDRTRSQIFYAIISSDQFGFIECQALASATPNSLNGKNHDMAVCGGTIPIVVYEDTVGTESKIFAVAFDPNTNLPVTPVQISDGNGNHTRPAIASCSDGVKVCWENDETGVKEIFFTQGACLSSTSEGATDSSQVGFTLAPLGTSIGLVDTDLSSAVSHGFFPDTYGMGVLDYDSLGRNASLAIVGKEISEDGIGNTLAGSGGIIVTSHDADATQSSAFLQKAVSYVTNSVASPSILYVTDFRNPNGDQVDGRFGMYSAGFTFDCADYAGGTEPGEVTPTTGSAPVGFSADRAGRTVQSLSTVDFSLYDAIVVSSDYGGWLRQEEVDILNARMLDIIAFVNSGGGLVVLNQTGNRPSYYPGVQRSRIGFLPFLTEYRLISGLEVGDVVFEYGTQKQITNSRGQSEFPSIACDSNGNTWIAFQDDRIRSGYPEIYIARFDATLNQWLSSDQEGLDTRIDCYVAYASKPKVILDQFSKSVILFETLGGSGKRTIASVNYDDSTNFNANVIGYFTLDDNASDTSVKNRIRNNNSSVVIDGTASNNTTELSIESPDTEESLFNPELQRSFDLKENGLAFKVDQSLIKKTGALEFWMRPHWDSTDVTTRVLFGNDDIGTTTPGKMVMSLEPITGGNALRLRLIDDLGNVRQTEVQNTATTNFSWSTDQSVHIRATWDEAAIGTSSMNCVSFSSTTTGLAVGPNGAIFRTTDSGVTWTQIFSGITYDLYSVDTLVDGVTAVACGEFGTVLKSTNGGLNWTVIETGFETNLNSIFINTLTGTYYAVGSYGLILRSTDAGVTWAQVSTDVSTDLLCVSVQRTASTSRVLVVGRAGVILRSTDDGVSFSDVSLDGVYVNLNALSRTHKSNSTTSYAVGDKGTILKSSNSGLTWTDISFTWSTSYLPNLYAVSRADNSSNVYVAGQNGQFAKSTDGGSNWIECKTAITQGSWKSIDAWQNDATSMYVTALGPGGSVMTSSDAVGIQNYYVTKSGNLTIFVNGIAPTQVRTGDSPFTWSPSSDLFFGDYQFSGSRTANAVFDELVIYDNIPNGSYIRRGNYFSKTFGTPDTIVSPETLKRIEFGSISTLSKNRSHWTNVDISYCGAKEPVKVFQWPAQLGLVDDVVMDMALDNNGFLWIATENGVSKFDTNSVNEDIERWLSGISALPNDPNRFINYTNIADGLVSDSINSIAVDGDGDVWMATSKGLMFFQRDQSSFEEPTKDPVDVAFEASNQTGEEKQNGTPGVGRYSNGAVVNRDPIVIKTLTKTTDGIVSDSVNVVRAYQNIILVGTDQGLSVITKSSKSSDADAKTTGTDAVTSDTAEQASTGDAITSESTGTSSSSLATSASSDQGSQQEVQTIDQTLQDTTNPSSDTNVQSSAEITFLVQNFDVNNGLPSNVIQSITYDAVAKEIILGTDNGMVRMTRDGKMNRVGTSEGLISNNIFSVTVDRTGRKIIGTDMGITIIDGLDFISYPPSSGPGYGAIRAGSADSTGSFWLATSTGLVQMDGNCENVKFITYDVYDGIIGDPNIRDFQRYRILGGSIPGNGCEKALVAVSVNGERLISGYEVNTSIPWITFDYALQPSDDVQVIVYKGWRKVKCFGTGDLDKKELAKVNTDRLKLQIYKKRFPAGLVTLGANYAQGASAGSSMYFVFASPLVADAATISSITIPDTAELTTTDKGNSIYSDEEELITLMPTSFSGLTAIAMASEDYAGQGDDYLEFTLDSDSIVYVAYDATAQSLPGWLRSFEPVEAVYRTTDMEVFTDGSGEEKLFVALAGTNGCVYEVLNTPDACDVSDSVALDATAPDGCAKISRVNSPTSVTLSISATDAVTGVQDMQVSARSDFTVDGETENDWVPYQSNYIFEVPPASITDVSTVVDLETVLPGATLSTLFDWNGTLLVSTNTPGRVYKLDKNTGILTLLFDTGEAQVTSLNSFGSYLLVGTGTNGRAFLWNGTTLTQLVLPGGETISAIGAFDNRAFFGTSPQGKVYQMDETLTIQLLFDTYETDVNGFAIFGGRLFWVTGNDQIEEGDILSTTTAIGHRHTITTAAGWVRLQDVNGTTSEEDGHTHDVIYGVVQPAADGHTHILNGINPGKVFRYDAATDNATIVHSDRDYKIASIASTSLDSQGLLFVGTYPNGKILRFIPTENIFIKSFDSMANNIRSMRVINDKVNATGDDDIFLFDGRRWVFQSSAGEDISDIIEENGDIVILTGTKILKTEIKSTTTVVPDRNICAYVRFRDAAGNVTKITDDKGDFIQCYSPCVNVQGSTTTDQTTDGTVTGDTTATETQIPPTVHRITEVNPNAKAISVFQGPQAFLSGTKVEEEVGIYESEVFNGTSSLVQWVSISWYGQVLDGSSITLAVRSSKTLSGIQDAEWSEEFTSATANDITNLIGQYMQFRATLKVTQAGVPSPELYKVDIQLRTSQAVHYYTTNFVLPEELRRGILTYNGCINPPSTDIVFAVSGLDSTDFADYYPIVPHKVFEVPAEHQRKNLRIGIKLISSPTAVPVVDEFALLFSLANDAIIRLNLADTPSSTGRLIPDGTTKTVTTDVVQGHSHSITFDIGITDKAGVNGQTSKNAGHVHDIINGVVQQAAGHSHTFDV